MNQVSNFQNTGKAVECKGDRSAYDYERGPPIATVTATSAFYLSVMMCPRMVTYPHQGLPSDITQTVPDDWEAGHSPTDGCQHKACTSILEMFSLHILQNIRHVPSFTYRLWTLHPIIISPEWTLLWTRLNLGLSTPNRRKTHPINKCCNFQTTKSGMENSSARPA
jgi:hypothetical protein